MFGYKSQFNRQSRSKTSRKGIVMIDMLVGLVILAAFLIFGTMVILQIEETKLNSLQRNDEMAWATMQQSAAIHGFQANTGSLFFNEASYNVSSAVGAPIRVNSSSSQEAVLTVGNLVITPRILTVSDVPGRRGNVSVGYVLQDCFTAVGTSEFMPREEPDTPEYVIKFMGADGVTLISEMASGATVAIDLGSDQVDWDNGDLILTFIVEGGSLGFNQVASSNVITTVDGVAFRYRVDASLISSNNIYFEAAFGDFDWGGTFVFEAVEVKMQHTRSSSNTADVTLTDVSPSLGIPGALGVNQLVTTVYGRGNSLLEASFIESLGIEDSINGVVMTPESIGTSTINYNPPASSFDDSGNNNDWDTTLGGGIDSVYLGAITYPKNLKTLDPEPSLITLTFAPAGDNYAGGVTVTIDPTYSDAYSASQLVNGVIDREYYALRYEVFEDSVAAASGVVTTASAEYTAAFYIQLDPGAEGYVEAKTFNSSTALQYFLTEADGSEAYFSEYGPIDFQWGNIDADYNGIDDRTEYTYDGSKADDDFHASVQTGGEWAIADNWYTVPDNWRDVVQRGENYLFAKHPVDGPITVNLKWYYSETGWAPKMNDPHYLGGLIFNNDVNTYTIMGPDESSWIPMYFNSDGSGRSLISVLNSPKHGEFEEEYDPHVLQVRVVFQDDLEINVSNTSSFKLEADQLSDSTGQYALYKTGPGKLYARVGNTGSNRPIYVEEGELICAIEDAFPNVPIYLNGGTLNLNRWEETFQSDLHILSDSSIDMGDGSDLYSGADDEFTFIFESIITSGVTVTFKNWSPGSDYKTTGGNSRLQIDGRDALPSWNELVNMDFEDWELVDSGYTSGGWVVPDGAGWNNWSIVPLAVPVQPNSRGYLYIEEDTHLYLDSNPDDGNPEAVYWEYEDLVIKNDAILYLHYFTNDGSNPDIINFSHPVDASTLSKVKIYTDDEEAKNKPKSDGVNQSLDSEGNIQAYWYY